MDLKVRKSTSRVPSHVGIEGNEMADDFANRGSNLEVISQIKITFSDAHSEVKRKMVAEWQEEYDYISRSKGIHHYKVQNKMNIKPWFHGMKLNGNAIKIMTRLRTNHGLCGMKKWLFKLEPNAICAMCNEINDLEHITIKCLKHQSVRSKFEFGNKHNELIGLIKSVDMKTYSEIINFYADAKLDF